MGTQPPPDNLSREGEVRTPQLFLFPPFNLYPMLLISQTIQKPEVNEKWEMFPAIHSRAGGRDQTANRQIIKVHIGTWTRKPPTECKCNYSNNVILKHQSSNWNKEHNNYSIL